MQPSWTTHSADGVEITAYEHGGDGEPLVIAHATGMCGAMYDDVARELTDCFRVVSFDFRGHGNSARPANDDFDWGRMAEDLRAVVTHVTGSESPAAVHGVGHSMGGAALLLAELASPGMFRSLYLFEPIVIPTDVPAGFTGPNSNIMATTARKRRPEFGSREEVLYRYASRPPLNLLRASVLAAYVNDGFADTADGRVRLKCLPNDEALTFEANGGLSVDMLGPVRTPTLVAAGHDEPGPNPGRFAPFVADALSKGSLRKYPSLGHFGPFQDPTAVATDIREHIAAVSA